MNGFSLIVLIKSALGKKKLIWHFLILDVISYKFLLDLVGFGLTAFIKFVLIKILIKLVLYINISAMIYEILDNIKENVLKKCFFTRTLFSHIRLASSFPEKRLLI